MNTLFDFKKVASRLKYNFVGTGIGSFWGCFIVYEMYERLHFPAIFTILAWSIATIAAVAYYSKTKKFADLIEQNKFYKRFLRAMLVGFLLATALSFPKLIIFLAIPYLLLFWNPLYRRLSQSSSPWIVEVLTEANSMRFACLSIALASINLILYYVRICEYGIVPTYNYYNPIYFLAMALPMVIAVSLSIKTRRNTQNSIEPGRKIKWHKKTFSAIVVAQILSITIILFSPGSIGDWLVHWLDCSFLDANLFQGWKLNRVTQSDYFWTNFFETINKQTDNKFLANFSLFLRLSASYIIIYCLMPVLVRTASTITAVIARLKILTVDEIKNKYLSVINSPVKNITLEESMPLLHNFSLSLLWYLFCYGTLIYVCGFLNGPIGFSITNWMDCTLLDAGFKLNIWQHPQLRILIAAMVAAMGAVPLAITGCVFLPSFKPKYILINQDGILIPKGPFFRLNFYPARLWSDFKALDLKGNTLSMKFHSGGSLKLKLKQLSKEDLNTLLSSIDEYSDNCRISQSIIDLRRDLNSNELPEDGDFRHLKAARFHSTIFTPLKIGDTIYNDTIRVVRQLSTKQLSAVYLVRLNDGKLAILKQFFVPEDKPGTQNVKKIFKRECQLLKSLNHEQISTVYEQFEVEESSFLLLEHASGEDLTKYISELGPMNETEILDLAVQLTDILIHLHSQDPPILHRDITPDNIVLDRNGYINLIDFGAAHQFLEGITGTLIGKQCYIAPEQLRGEPETKSDIYSFGCTLHYLLTGLEPKALSQCDPAQVTKVSKNLNTLIKQCTEFDSSKRPNSFIEIKKQLTKILTPPPTEDVRVEREKAAKTSKLAQEKCLNKMLDVVKQVEQESGNSNCKKISKNSESTAATILKLGKKGNVKLKLENQDFEVIESSRIINSEVIYE